MEGRAPLARLRGVTKRFGAVVALSDVSIDVSAGQLHAVVGENGAGKSTLGRVLTGALRPDAGDLCVDGAPVALASPRQARARGFAAVHQHSALVPTLTVAENLILGGPWFRRPARDAARRRLAQERAFGVALDADALAGGLSLGEQQQVEILRALWSGCRLLVLDEATAMQTPAQAALLIATLRRLADGGLAVVTITHKLEEAAQADRVTVLRRGVVAGSLSPAALRHETPAALQARLIGLMFADAPPPPTRRTARAGAPVLEVRGLSARGRPPLENIAFDVAAGEVFGIAGIDGNGQAALARLLAGEATPQGGTVRFDGRALAGSVAARRRDGLRHVSDDRLGEETIGGFAVAINLVLKHIGAPPFWRCQHRAQGLVEHRRSVTDAYGDAQSRPVPHQTVKNRTVIASVISTITTSHGRRRVIGVAAAAAHASGTYGSQIRSVSALVKPATALTTTITASPTAAGSPRCNERSASQTIGGPSSVIHAAGEPNSQNA